MNSKREIQNSSSLSQSFEGSSSSSRLVQQPFDPGATYKPTPPLGMINTKNDNLLMAPRARNGSDLTSSGPQTAPLPRSKSSKMFFQQQNNASGAGINEPKKNFPSLFFNSPAIKLRRPKSASGRLLIDAFYNVSDEIIVEVFKYLPKKCLVKCAQVSKRWSRIRLREVNVGWAYLTSEMQKMLCTRLPDTMRRLNISGCRADEKALSDDDLEFLICSCPDLTELDISDCIKVTGAGLDTLLEGLDSLAVLNCSRCYGIEPICYTYCTKLKELNMHGCITDEGLKVVGERLGKGVKLCENLFSTIARPTVGIRRTSIWEYRVRDE